MRNLYRQRAGRQANMDLANTARSDVGHLAPREPKTRNVLSASYGTLANLAGYSSIGPGDDMDSNIKRIIGIALLIIGAWVVYDGTTTGETLTIILGAASVLGGICFLFIRRRRVT